MKIIKNNIIIPIKVCFKQKKLKELEKKWEILETVTRMISSQKYLRETNYKKVIQNIEKIQKLSYAITGKRLKTIKEIHDLKMERTNG